MDQIQKNLLAEIAGLHEVPAGAYNFRVNGAAAGRNTTSNIDIVTKTDKPGLKNIMVGLGWDVNAFDSGVDFDLDAAAFMLGADGKCPTDKEFVFYGNLAHPSESVKHMGDNLTGEGEGDDEQIQIDLSKVPANIERIAFTVTIYEAEARRQNFGQVSNSFIRLVDETTGKEMIRYDLGEDFSIETAVVVGE